MKKKASSPQQTKKGSTLNMHFVTTGTPPHHFVVPMGKQLVLPQPRLVTKVKVSVDAAGDIHLDLHSS